MIALTVVVFVLVFVTAMASWFVLTRVSASADVEKRRERILGARVKAQKEPTKVALFESEERPKGMLIPKLIERFSLGERLRSLSDQAGVKVDPVRFVQLSMACFFAAFLGARFGLPSSWSRYALAAAFLGGALPLLYLRHKRAQRLNAFEEIFPDALEFISRSMRAGHAFSVSLEMIHREFKEPLAGEFRRTFEEHNLGLPLDVALLGLSRRVQNLDVHFFVSAVLLQKRTGGNLAEILDKLAFVIRERFKLRGRIKAIGAHGKMTGMALTSIPAVVAVLMYFVNPEDILFFFNDEIGNYMLGGALTLQVLGYLVIRRIVSIQI